MTGRYASCFDFRGVSSINGEVQDETGLIYLRARYYDPSMGRFIQIDNNYDGEEDVVNSQNKYIYTLNNPYKYVDRDGNRPLNEAALFLEMLTKKAADGWIPSLWISDANGSFPKFQTAIKNGKLPDKYHEDAKYKFFHPPGGIEVMGVMIKLKAETAGPPAPDPNPDKNHNNNNTIGGGKGPGNTGPDVCPPREISQGITECPDTRPPLEKQVHQLSTLRMDTDGPNDAFGSTSHQNQVAIGLGIRADVEPYIVIPSDYPNRDGIKGTMGLIVDNVKKTSTYAIVADVGRAENGMGEVSLRAAWDLGYSREEAWGTHFAPPTGASYTIIIFPDTHQDWKNGQVRQQLMEAGDQLNLRGR